jgi:serine/threonine-protein kinase RsbT
MMREIRALGKWIWVAIRDESDVVVARRHIPGLGLQVGLPEARIAALATAVTEIARNIVVHAGSGEMSLAAAADARRHGIVVIARDVGPGIPDIAQAMQDGYSTRGGLGSGLAGAQRLVDEFEIESAVGSGVTIKLRQLCDAKRWN